MNLGIFSIGERIYFRANTVDKQGSALDSTTGPTFSVFGSGGTIALASGTLSKVGSNEGFYQGNFAASTSTFSTGQHFILLNATVDGETPNAHISFQLVKKDQSIEDTFQEIETIGASIPIVGTGTVSIDHNFGSTDALRILANGTPVADVNIRAFVTTDYAAGRKANLYVVGQSKTGTNGRWVAAMRLDPGSYTLEFSKPGQYRINTTTITVT